MGNPLGTPSRITLNPLILEEISLLGHRRKPREACGVLLPVPRVRAGGSLSQVVELPNRCMGRNEYEIHTTDIQMELQEWAEENPDYTADVAIWHTHPGGNIGPSRGDLKGRLEGIPYLVVALTESGPVPAWF